MGLAQISLDEAQKLANEQPCFSMMALTTLLVVRGHYPVPLDFDAQESILNSISKQIQKNWDEVLEEELEVLKDECLQSDIDFDFVIDSSGSVGQSNWDITMQMIGQNWIKEILVPNGSKVCGNHVAGRWFSSSTQRFHDFEPPSKDVYAPKTYADYVGDIFINYPYNSGGTDTAQALEKVRTEDIPTARKENYIAKYVMVFTDGKSGDKSATIAQAKLLHGVSNRTYALGIGSGVDYEELKEIASNDSYVGDMTTFSQLQAFSRKFVREQKGCATLFKQAHRSVNLDTMTHYGMSYQTASGMVGQVSAQCAESSECPYEVEKDRTSNCISCSEQIGKQPSLSYLYTSNHYFKLNFISHC